MTASIVLILEFRISIFEFYLNGFTVQVSSVSTICQDSHIIKQNPQKSKYLPDADVDPWKENVDARHPERLRIDNRRGWQIH